jgi:hypothetical protein
MFPDLRQMRQRIEATLGEWCETRYFRLGVAALFAVMHLALFSKAGHERLGLPFNSAPNHAPYYSNPDASSVRGYPRQPHYWSRLIVSRWDSEHYIGFAIRGVTACPTDGAPGPVTDLAYLECGLGWLPAYGVLGGAVSQVTGIADDVALVFISILCAIVLNFLLTSRTIMSRLGKLETYGALIALNLYPSAFYLVTPYTEAMTYALVIGGFIALSQERWFVASLLVGASTALRASAVAFAAGLGCAAVLAAWMRREKGETNWWRPLLGIPACGWGMALQMLLLKIFVGDGLAFLRARDAFGDDHDFSRIFDLEFYLKGFTGQHMDAVMLVGTFAIIALTVGEVAKRLRPEQLVYLAVATGVTIILGIAAVHEYWGLNRYLLLCPLTFVCAGVMARKHPYVFALWLVLCAAIYWHVELCSYISQGNPQYCPCLGRMEFWMPF